MLNQGNIWEATYSRLYPGRLERTSGASLVPDYDGSFQFVVPQITEKAIRASEIPSGQVYPSVLPIPREKKAKREYKISSLPLLFRFKILPNGIHIRLGSINENPA